MFADVTNAKSNTLSVAVSPLYAFAGSSVNETTISTLNIANDSAVVESGDAYTRISMVYNIQSINSSGRIIVGSEINNTQDFNSNSLTIYDLGYNPIDGKLYSTTNGIQNSLNGYTMPETPSLNSNPDYRYHVMRIKVSGGLTNFNISIPNNNACVSNAYVYWGGGDAGGWQIFSSTNPLSDGNRICAAASANLSQSGNIILFPIRINPSTSYTYTQISPSEPYNYIYVALECPTSSPFGGNMPFSEFNII